MKKLIKKWLGIDILSEELYQCKEKIKILNMELRKSNELFLEVKQELYDSKQLVENCLNTMNSICEVAVDISPMDRSQRYDENFAVVCIHGKRNYIKLCKLNQQDIRGVESFLRQFKYSNRIVDSYFPFDSYL